MCRRPTQKNSLGWVSELAGTCLRVPAVEISNLCADPIGHEGLVLHWREFDKTVSCELVHLVRIAREKSLSLFQRFAAGDDDSALARVLRAGEEQTFLIVAGLQEVSVRLQYAIDFGQRSGVGDFYDKKFHGADTL